MAETRIHKSQSLTFLTFSTHKMWPMYLCCNPSQPRHPSANLHSPQVWDAHNVRCHCGCLALALLCRTYPSSSIPPSYHSMPMSRFLLLPCQSTRSNRTLTCILSDEFPQRLLRFLLQRRSQPNWPRCSCSARWPQTKTQLCWENWKQKYLIGKMLWLTNL